MDYSVDAEAGVVYLMVPTKAGQSVVVTYRYDASRARTGEAVAASSLQPLRLNFGSSGSLGLMFGMGLTERTQEGSVLTSNVFGWNNSFNTGGGSSLSGLMLFGERNQADAQSMYEYQGAAAAPDLGKSKLIMQSLAGKMGGGTFQFDFQDVSKNFSGFSAVQANGYDASVAERLSKERGLQRVGTSFNNVRLGGLGFSQSYKTVGDGKSAVTWRSYGVNVGGLNLNYNSQSVDQNFKRFADLSEVNREQLAREAGLSRQGWDGALKFADGALTFNTLSIADQDGQGIGREEWKLDTSKFKFLAGKQSIRTGFSRFDSLSEADKGQWARESGLQRQWKQIETPLFGGAQPLKFAEYKIDSPSGQMSSTDASVGGRMWSLEHISRNVDTGFAALPNLTQGEIDGNIGAISKMYVAGGMPVRPEDRGSYFQSPGLSRDFTRFTATPFADWKVSFETLNLRGKEDEGGLDNLSLVGKRTRFSYRDQKLGPKFTELGTMMEFERQRLGTLPGLSRKDMEFATELSRKGSLNLSMTNADSPNGGFKRQSLSYFDPKMQLNLNSRSVDPNFSGVGQVLDPEVGQLSQMVGFKEADAQIKWQVLPNLRLEAMTWNGLNNSLDQRRRANNLLLDWGPNKNTQLQYMRTSMDFDDPSSILLANSLERLAFSHDLGRYGILKYTDQTIKLAGTQNNQPGSKMTDMSYETKLNATTSVKTEQI
ncbi:MAG: hypothetical protein QOJ65_1930, partial [Fimbriimonadaceae bacterium]|nr:hypothetical protein [Fimbriimonadaceae bacterium]